MVTIEFKPLKSDLCIYTYTHKNGIYNPGTKREPMLPSWNKDTVILTIYVDDLLLVGQNKVLLEQLEEKLVRRFDTKCMGDVSMVLGMQVTRNREKGTFTISQAHYTKSVLETYGNGGVETGVHDRSRAGAIDQPGGMGPSEQSRHAAVPVHRRQRRVPGSSKPLRHPLRRLPASAGNVEAIESAHVRS